MSQDENHEIESGLKVWADVGVSLGRSADKMHQAAQRLEDSLQINTPVYYSPVASGTFTTGQTLILDLGSPDQGTYWEVMNISVGGVDYITTAAGSCGIYVSSLSSNAGGMMNLMDFSTSLPNKAFYSTRQMWINDQQHLIVGINGGTNNQLYVASAAASVFQIGSGKGTVATVA
jgi:hypothetical protein